MHTSVPVSDEDTLLFGLSWRDIFRLRDSRAKVYARRFGYRVPLEELLSSGNLAITEALAKYVPRADNPSFKAYLWAYLDRAYQACRRQELKECFHWPGKHRGPRARVFQPVQYVSIDEYPVPTQTHYARQHDTRRVLSYLAQTATPQQRQMLLASFAGETDKAIAQTHGVSLGMVFRRNQQLLRQLQAWACQGMDLPQARCRRYGKLTPQLHATIKRLLQQGMPQTAIARRVGIDRSSLYRHFSQENRACHD